MIVANPPTSMWDRSRSAITIVIGTAMHITVTGTASGSTRAIAGTATSANPNPIAP